jgi:hypothetical protein
MLEAISNDPKTAAAAKKLRNNIGPTSGAILFFCHLG